MHASSHIPAELHRALGHALTNWQYVETGMFVLAHAMLGTDYPRTSAVFFHIQSASSKLQLIDKLLRLEFDDKWIKDNWQKGIRNEITRTIDVRNGLAHFEAVLLNPKDSAEMTKFPAAIMPHRLDVLAERDGQIKGLFVETLHETAEACLRTARRQIVFGSTSLPRWTPQLERLPPDLRRVLEEIRTSPEPT
jgi:hypothetical protein